MEDIVIVAFQRALVTALVVSSPAALCAIVIGLAIAVFQTTTQIQEQSLTFVPKLLGVCVALLVGGGWMLAQLVRFALSVLEQIPVVGK